MKTNQPLFPAVIASTIVAAGFLAYFIAVVAVLYVLQWGYDQKHTINVPERPDFSAFVNVNEKKQAFFGYVGVLAEIENQRIQKKRNRLEYIANAYSEGNALTRRQKKWVLALGIEYSVSTQEGSQEIQYEPLFDALRKRVNIVPIALVQAQAAIESGWGTSRFALEANNLFGQWCFSKGCGVVPESRVEGRTHEVAQFASDGESIRAYMRNLNTFSAYKQLRALRAGIAPDRLGKSGAELAAALIKYSERGEAYVHEVQHMIRSNTLEH